MRADRLIAVLLLLQAKGQITAAEVAQELEVSTRTARRDLEALAMSGVPLYSQAGRGGGWRLIGGARTDLTGLSSTEAQALFLALGPQREANPALDAALRKLVVALPEGFRQDAVAATSAIRVDPAGWGRIGDPEERQEWVDELSHAVIAGRQVIIRYTRPGSDPADRTVHPLGLVTKRGVWYMVANTDRGIRTYRLSRISDVTQLDAPVDRPADFDLDKAWEAIVTTVSERFAGLTVRVTVHAEAMWPFRRVFGGRHEVIAEHDDGSFEVVITEVSPRSLAAQIAGFGAAIELIDPPADVTAEMTRVASELAAQYLQ